MSESSANYNRNRFFAGANTACHSYSPRCSYGSLVCRNPDYVPPEEPSEAPSSFAGGSSALLKNILSWEDFVAQIGARWQPGWRACEKRKERTRGRQGNSRRIGPGFNGNQGLSTWRCFEISQSARVRQVSEVQTILTFCWDQAFSICSKNCNRNFDLEFSDDLGLAAAVGMG